jgi:hypothetical protein
MMAARADVGEFVAWLGERRFRFWRIGDSGSLSEIDRSAVAMLPHCDLLLSRDDPARPE